MTVTFVRAYSLAQARDYMQGIGVARKELTGFTRVAWIGFVPTGPSPIEHLNNAIVIEMDDVAEHHACGLTGERLLDGTPLVRPSIEIARRIVRFVRKRHADAGEWALAIHCTAGISRSGAVARWAWETCKPPPARQPAAMFAEQHERTHPNQSLLRLLQEASR